MTIKMRLLKILGKVFSILSVLLLVFIALFFTIFSLPEGRLWLIQTGIEAANNDALQIQVDNLKSPRLGKLSLDHLSIHVNDEKLLEVHSFLLEWSPLSLVSKRVEVKTLSADIVHLYKPSKTASNEKAEEQQGLNEISSPVAIQVKKIAVNTIRLHSFKLSGEDIPPLNINASINAFTQSQLIELSLKLNSLTEKPTHLTLNARSESPKTFELSGQLSEPERNWIAEILKLPKKETLDASFSLELDTTDPQWEIGIKNVNLPLFEHNIKMAGTAFVDLKNRNYQAQEIILTTDDKEHRLRGAYGSENLWFDLKLNQFPLTIVKPWIEEIESGTITGKFQGDWLHTKKDTWPHVKANARINARAKGQNASAELEGELSNKIISLTQSEFKLEQSTAKIQGTIDAFGDRSSVDFWISKFNSEYLAPWPVKIPNDISFFVDHAEGKVSGALKSPDYQVKANANIEYQATLVNTEAQLQGNLEQADFKALKLSVLETQLELDGLVAWRKAKNNFNLSVKNLNQELLTFVPKEALKNIPNNLTFQSDFSAKISGDLLKPQLDTDGTVKGQYPIEKENLPFHLDFDLEAQVAPLENLTFNIDKLELSLFEKSALSAKGQYSKDAFDIHTRVDRLPTQTLALFGITNLKGSAAANINVSGNLKKPKVNGDFKYNYKYTDSKSNTVPVALSGKIATVEDTFSLALNFSEKGKNAGNLSLEIPLSLYLDTFIENQTNRASLPLNAKLNADLNLTTINNLLNPELHQFSGHIDTELSLTGTLDQASANGYAKLRRGQYSHLAFGTHLTNIELNLVSENDVLKIQKAQISTPESGKINMEGFLDWQGFLDKSADKLVDIAINAKDAVLFEKQDINAKISGRLNLAGDREKLLLDGKLSPTPLNISIDSALKTNIPEIKVTEVKETTPGRATKANLPTINLKIDVNVDQQAFIRGRGLETEVAGNVQVRGTASSPEITGEFKTRRGKLDAFGKTFVLQNGQVRISNDIIGLNIPAVYTGKDHEYRIEIYGTSDQPKFNISAVPSLPEDEILSRLIFGKSVQEITPFQALRLAQAVRTLSTGGGFDPLDSARHMLGVDSIKIDSENTEDGQQVSVGIGKYISEGVYLEVERSNNPAQPWEGSIQIELTPRVRLKGGTGETGAGEAEILWKKDY